MSSPMISLPLEPLYAIAKVKADLPLTPMEGRGFSDQYFADMIGVSSRAVARWRSQDNRVPWVTADEAATRLGLHPLLVWGDEWLLIDEDIINGHPSDRKVKEVEKALRQIGEVLKMRKPHDRAAGESSPRPVRS